MKPQTRVAIYMAGFLIGAMITAFLFVHRSGLRDQRGSDTYTEIWESLGTDARPLPEPWSSLLEGMEIRHIGRMVDPEKGVTTYSWLIIDRDPVRIFRMIESINPTGSSDTELYAGDRLTVVGIEGQDFQLLKDGVENSGYRILESDPDNRTLVVSFNPFPIEALSEALHFLRTRRFYVEGAEPIPVSVEDLSADKFLWPGR